MTSELVIRKVYHYENIFIKEKLLLSWDVPLYVCQKVEA